jgi:hypothetical protein
MEIFKYINIYCIHAGFIKLIAQKYTLHTTLPLIHTVGQA